jgi:hypothetical protein
LRLFIYRPDLIAWTQPRRTVGVGRRTKTIYKKITRVKVIVSKSAFKLKFGQDEYAEVKWEKQLKQLIQEKLIKQDKLPEGSLGEITL